MVGKATAAIELVNHHVEHAEYEKLVCRARVTRREDVGSWKNRKNRLSAEAVE